MTENEAKRYGEDYLKDLACAVCKVEDRHKDFVRMSIKALEKQIPKKTILQRSDEKSLYKCPCCDSIFVEAYENMQRGYIPKFCEMCGQSISFRLE